MCERRQRRVQWQPRCCERHNRGEAIASTPRQASSLLRPISAPPITLPCRGRGAGHQRTWCRAASRPGRTNTRRRRERGNRTWLSILSVQRSVQVARPRVTPCVFAAIGGQAANRAAAVDGMELRWQVCRAPPRRIYSRVAVYERPEERRRRCRHQDDGVVLYSSLSAIVPPDLLQRSLVALCRHFQTLLDEVGQFEQARAMFLPPLLVKPRTFIERDIVGRRIEGLQKICDINRLRADARPS